MRFPEERQQATGEISWREGHRVDLAGRDEVGTPMAVSLAVGVIPAERRAWFVAVVLGSGRRPVVLIDEAVPFPERGWEIRTTGLWADHNCETPQAHWSYGLEAFALAVDEPDQLLRADVGDRVPLGWDFEFESSAMPERLAGEGLAGEGLAGEGLAGDTRSDEQRPAVPLVDGYRQVGMAHGVLLGDHPSFEFEGMAIRHHWWGPADPRSVGVGLLRGMSLGLAMAPVDGGYWQYELFAEGVSARFVV